MKWSDYIKCGILGLGLSLTSCEDWLLVEPENVRSTNYFYSTPSEMEQALSGIYNGLLPLPEYTWFMSEVRSDNAWSGGGSSTARDYIEISVFNKNITELSTLNDAWCDLYEIVSRANIFLEKAENIEMPVEGVKEQQTAEARFLRALAYFDLVRYWGRVPLTLEPLTINEMMAMKQAETVDIYEQGIIPDLEYAIANLSDTPIDYLGNQASAGRVTLQAAKALLGKVYLTMAGYPLMDESKKSKARDLFEQVIDYADANNKFWAKDADEWQKIWISDNDNKYHIFEIQYIAESGFGNPMIFYTTPKLPTEYIGISMSGYGTVCSRGLNKLLKEETDAEGHFLDVRCLATVDTTKVLGKWKYNNSEDFFIKFMEHKIKRQKLGYSDIDAQIVDRGYFPINFPIIRLEDVMLMYAEIVGPTDRGKEMVNRIHKRATGENLFEEGETVIDEDFQFYVDLERRKEFAGEGIRWHDIVRRNTYKDAIKMKFYEQATDSKGNVTEPDVLVLQERVTEGTHLYPIPDAQMKVKEGLYEQNPAYK